jgi:hypothetical protein
MSVTKKLLAVGAMLLLPPWAVGQTATADSRPRASDLGLRVGILPPGRLDAITDVAGVQVGHSTIVRGENIRTGVTAIHPHSGNLYREKVPGAIFVGNGFGRLAGHTQLEEMGNIETPILLTSTTSVPRVADAVLSYMLALPGNEDVLSINPVVGETKTATSAIFAVDISRQRTSLPPSKTPRPGRWKRARSAQAPAQRLSDGREASEPLHASYPAVWADIPSVLSCRPILAACLRLPALP